MKNGFTLIELLVVILIIGILAAVAIPQYQVAAKVSQIKAQYPNMRALLESRVRYYQDHRTFTTDMSELDVQLPYNRKEGAYYYTDWGWFYLSNVADDAYRGVVRFSVNNTDASIAFQYGHITTAWGKVDYQGECVTSTESKMGNKICSKLGTKKVKYSNTYRYLF